MGKKFNRDIHRVQRVKMDAAFQRMQLGQAIDPQTLGMIACSSCGATKVTLQRVSEKCEKPVRYACETCQDEGLRGVGGRLGRIKQMARTFQSHPLLLEQGGNE